MEISAKVEMAAVLVPSSRVAVDADRIAALRAQGAPWRAISRQLGQSVRTARRATLRCGKNQPRALAASA